MTQKTGCLGAVLATVATIVAMSPSPAWADNTNAANAVSLPADGTTKSAYIFGSGGSITERWYVAALRGGRSYSIALTEFNPTNTQSVYVDAVLFAVDGTSAAPGTTTVTDQMSPAIYATTTTLGSFYAGSLRRTYIPAAADNANEVIFIRVRDCCGYITSATNYAYFKISVTETTLRAPWFFAGAPYEAFTQIQNTTNAAVSGTVTHYASVPKTGGATSVCGSPVAFSIPASSSTYIQARTDAGCASSGGVKLTFNGPPGAIQANVTSVNTTGVGLTHAFNMPLQPLVTTPQFTGSN